MTDTELMICFIQVPMQCRYCDELYHDRWSLMQHQKTHRSGRFRIDVSFLFNNSFSCLDFIKQINKQNYISRIGDAFAPLVSTKRKISGLSDIITSYRLFEITIMITPGVTSMFNIAVECAYFQYLIFKKIIIFYFFLLFQ